MSKSANLTEEEIIQKVKFALNDWAFEDILRTSSGGAKMGAFILASCYIDYLAWYYSGGKGVGQRYRQFVKRFLKMYNPDDLYKSLRCKLVHNYSEGGKYEFTHNKHRFHLKTSQFQSRTVVNLNDFLEELGNARDQYFNLVDSDVTLRSRLIEKYKITGILGPSPIDTAK